MTAKPGAPRGNEAWLAARKQVEERNAAARGVAREKRHAESEARRQREIAEERASRASTPSHGEWIGP